MAIARHTAPAKLTRTLRVTGVRPDGLHLLESEMVTVDLCDVLEISPGEGLELVWETRPSDVSLGPDNLVTRALAAVGRRAKILLRKRVPAGAGLGGGSADAAAVLRWAGLGSSPGDLRLAAGLGADVAFCLRGGRALVSGIGDVVEQVDFRELRFALVTPPAAVSSAAVYRRWDELGGPQGPGDNDLEQAALSVEPALAAWREALATVTGGRPSLAGSGSSWFVQLDPHQQEPAATTLSAGGATAALLVLRSVPQSPLATSPPGAASVSP
ncbi:MAG: 4-(cytidine 5'-diphospho)-2-C-methyl-D-erythritol kinase [Acidimicrobiales bacterium]